MWNVPPRFSEPGWQDSSSHDSSSWTLHSISDTHSEWWVTPLWFFTLSHISKLNLNSGGEIDSVDKDGNTPLHIAARYGHELLINTLITNGADCTRFVSCHVENCSVVPNMMSLTGDTAASVKARCPWHVPAPPGCLERSLRLLQETALLRYNLDTSASFLIKLAVWSSTTSTLTVLGGNWLFMWLTWCSQQRRRSHLLNSKQLFCCRTVVSCRDLCFSISSKSAEKHMNINEIEIINGKTKHQRWN